MNDVLRNTSRGRTEVKSGFDVLHVAQTCAGDGLELLSYSTVFPLLQGTGAVDIAIKKTGHRGGVERFILVNAKTREVITVHDVTEESLRRYFRQRRIPDGTVDQCLARARERYQKSPPRPQVDEAAETMEGDDLLFQLGLTKDASTRP